jgi:hypothetical protein
VTASATAVASALTIKAAADTQGRRLLRLSQSLRRVTRRSSLVRIPSTKADLSCSL